MGAGASCPSTEPHAFQKTKEIPGLKIAVVGDSQVGKSCVMARYIHNQFSPLYVPTHKADIENVVQKINVPGHATLPITFWDIPSKEDLPLHQSYFRNLDAVIVVVDITDKLSIESGQLWKQAVLNNASFTKHRREGEEGKEGGVKLVKEKNIENKVVTETYESLDVIENEENNGDACKDVNQIPFLLLGNKYDLIKQEWLQDSFNQGNGEMTELGSTGSTFKPSTELLDCVGLLKQQVAEGFVGGVPVSAKANNLSIHAAIQNFLRHILENRYMERKWRPHVKQVTVKRARYELNTQLQLVGMDEIDAEFVLAEVIIQRVTTLHLYQMDALTKFVEQCVNNDVISNICDASLQNCLVGLRDKINSQELQLKFTTQGNFYLLEVKASTKKAELEKPTRLTIKTFNNEYAAVTQAMLKEYPLALKKLAQIDKQVDNLCKQYQTPLHNTTAAPSSRMPSTAKEGEQPQHQVQQLTCNDSVSQDDLQEKFGIIEENRAIMRHIIHECHDNLAHIERSFKQAKAAFVW